MLKVNKTILVIFFYVAVCSMARGTNPIFQIRDSISELQDSLVIDSIYKEILSIEDSLLNDTVKTLPIDSSSVFDNLNADNAKVFKPNPNKAIIYSAIFPGLGQIYNQKYWKLPILYGGFVGVSYAITWNNTHYLDYFNGYKDILDDNPDTNSWHDLLPYGQDYEDVDKEWFTRILKDRKNYFRYYRDLSIIIGIGLYGLGIIDAYVDAQLFEFDISPDLSMKIEPVMMSSSSNKNFIAESVGFRCSFSF